MGTSKSPQSPVAMSLLVCLALLCSLQPRLAAAEKPVVAVLVFESRFDNGKAGMYVANAIVKKLQRTYRYVVVDPMSAGEAADAVGFKFRFDIAPAAIADFGREGLAAHILVYGKVERAGAGYTIHLRAWDLRKKDAKPQLAMTERATDRRDLPLACVRLADALTPAEVQIERAPTATVPEAKRKNLLKNGDFEQGAASPNGWQPVDNLTLFWSDKGKPGKCLRVDTDVYEEEALRWRKQLEAGASAAKAPRKTITRGKKYDTIAGTYGVHYRSDPIPVGPGVTYRVSVDIKGRSGGIFFPKCFIKGYARAAKGEFAEQDREVYRAFVACHTETQGREWEHFTRTITPNPHLCIYDLEAPGNAAADGTAQAAGIRTQCRNAGYAVLEREAQNKVIAASAFAPRFDMPLPELMRFTTGNLHAVAAIWGRIEHDGEKKMMRLRVASARYKRNTPLLDLRYPVNTEQEAEKARAEFAKRLRETIFVTQYVRVMPYSYWPPGEFHWDNIRMTVEDALPRTGPEDHPR